MTSTVVVILVSKGADAKMPNTKNIERLTVSVGDQISKKKSTSGFTWDRISSKTKIMDTWVSLMRITRNYINRFISMDICYGSFKRKKEIMNEPFRIIFM